MHRRSQRLNGFSVGEVFILVSQWSPDRDSNAPGLDARCRLQPWTAYCRNTCVCLLSWEVLSQCQDMVRLLVIQTIYRHLQIHIGVWQSIVCHLQGC